MQQREDRAREPRFMMLESIRQYAFERLKESGEEIQTRHSHAAYALVLAEEPQANGAQCSISDWVDYAMQSTTIFVPRWIGWWRRIMANGPCGSASLCFSSGKRRNIWQRADRPAKHPEYEKYSRGNRRPGPDLVLRRRIYGRPARLRRIFQTI